MLATDIPLDDKNNFVEGIEKNKFFCFLKLFDKSLNSDQIGAYFEVLDEGNKKFLS
jgi:hypothetical protein